MSETTPLLQANGERTADSCASAKSQSAIFWEEVRTIPLYALPILAYVFSSQLAATIELIVNHDRAQLLEHSLFVVEVISVGHISTAALAGASLGSMTASVTGYCIIQGLTSALDTLLPSAFTSSKPQLMGLWAQRMCVVVFFALIPIFAIWLRAETILIWMKQDPEVAKLSALYLRWVSFSLPALLSSLELQLHFSINMFVAPVNALLSYLLGQMATEWWAWEMLALAASFLGPLSLASQSVLLTSSATTYQALFALANATTIRVGHFLGEKKAKHASIAASASLVVALMVSLSISVMYITSRKVWAHIFSEDPDVIDLVASILPFLALYQVLDATSSVSAGILRAKGQQHMGLAGLWTGMVVALTYCAVIGATLVYRTDWEQEVAKVEKRLAEEERTPASNGDNV
ncbi:hypothetical protein H0H92_002904 [Tricholoma furcatifolium]|nr:hypothetical protein H0H92_002904 [Tricholoma furcatifolium]